MENIDGLLDVDLIDELGVSAIAEELDITSSGVRNWRSRGIPNDRRGELLTLLVKQRGTAVEPATQGVPNTTQGDTTRDNTFPVVSPPSLSTLMPMQPERQLWLSITGRGGGKYARAMIAARRLQQARKHADHAASVVNGLPPIFPVRGYAARLFLLFALDFPVLTMAFVAVTQVSPIVAAGSALALSLFLVLGAHALGGPLRDIAQHLPTWCRSLTSIVVIGVLLVSVIWATIDLRLKGFEIEGLVAALAGGDLVFGDPAARTLVLPPEIQWAIVRAAALVTIMATTFGIGWSYQRHAPQAAFARAERAYAKALTQHAIAISRLKLGGKAASTAVALALVAGVVLPNRAEASSCDGKTVAAFVDATTAYDDEDRAAIMPAVERMAEALLPGQRVIIRTVRDRAESSRILFDRCVPETTGISWSFQGLLDWITSNPTEARAQHASFFNDMKRVLVPELQVTSAASKTALVETIGHGVRAAGDGSLDTIWIFSDLLESAAVPAGALLTDSDSLETLASTFPPLDGAGVHAAGIGRFHDESRRPLDSLELGTLVDSWSGLIGSAGGQLLVVR